MVEIAGTIDAAATKDIEKVFADAANDGGQYFIVDFSNMEYISSAGLRLLLKFRKAALDAGGALKIAALHRDIRENVFDALGFSKLIDVYPSVDDALASIGQEKT